MNPARSDTAEKILEVVEELIQTRSYNAFSYYDVAERVGIRTASIHYHFPTKAVLGRVIIERYSARLSAQVKILEQEESDPIKMLDRYLEFFYQYAESGGRVCLCGTLAGEYGALPAEMRNLVTKFFLEHENWLADLFAKGRDAGVFTFSADPAVLGRTFLAAVQGGLLISRTVDGGPEKFESSVSVFLSLLGQKN